MKTLTLKNAAGDVNITLKVDIFATDTQLQDPTFETRFTHMSIENYTDLAKSKINLQEIEYSWRGLISLVEGTQDLGLFIVGDKASNPGKSKLVFELESPSSAGNIDVEYVDLNGSTQTITGWNFSFNLETTASAFVSDQTNIDALATGGITATSDGTSITLEALSSTPMMQTLASTDPSAIDVVFNGGSGDLDGVNETFSVVNYEGEVLIVEI